MKTFQAKSGIQYQQPKNEAEVKELVQMAADRGKTLIVHGARHSFPLSDDPLQPHDDLVFVLPTYLNKVVSANREKGIFTVQAGCRIGYDPFDETRTSTVENSLVYQLDPLLPNGRRTVPPGWALPDLGGITHQTIGGFIATGSSGGTIQHAFHEAIQSIRLVYFDGNMVQDKVFCRPPDGNPDDPFWAVAYANLGLMGFMLEVTFQCVPAYNVQGTEVTSSMKDSLVDLTFYNSTSQVPIHHFLNEAEFSRLLWWPQGGIDKVMVWAGNKKAIDNWQNFEPQPYKSLPLINGSTDIANRIFGAIFSFLGNTLVRLRQMILKLFGKSPAGRQRINRFFNRVTTWLLKQVLAVFARNGTQTFCDAWWRTLPMDNQVSDKFSPVKLTELWIPLEKSVAVLEALKQFYRDPDNAGTFCSELYAGKANSFWLSPGYQTDAIRVDVFWFGRNAGNPVDYFERFWRFLQPFQPRFHWGKYLTFQNPKETQHFLLPLYPRWQQFMELRRTIDPKNVFLNPYWKKHLGIQ